MSTSKDWGACPECGHPQHVTTPCYRHVGRGRRCTCPAQPKERRS